MPTTKWSTGPQDAEYERMISGLYNDTPGIGKVGRYYKQLLARLGAGEDVSGYGEFNELSNVHAGQRQGIEEGYMTGANALEIANNPDNALVLNRMKQYEMDKQRQNEGMDTTRALSDLRTETTGGLSHAIDARNQMQTQQKLAALGARGNYYQARHVPYTTKSWWDKAMDVANLAVGGYKAYKGGA